MSDIKNNTFHITITDNETGEIRVDENTVAIIGAFDAGDEGTRGMSFTNCNLMDLAYTAHVARKCAEETLAEEPLARAYADFLEAKDRTTETEE